MLHPLVNQVKTIKENSDYRLGDILYQRGYRWKHSLHNVKKKKKYKNTILQKYLRNNINDGLNYNLLLKCIKNFNNNLFTKIKKPKDKEIVMHLRLGDKITEESFLKKDFISLIREKINLDNKINLITIVTCYQYAPFSADSLHLAPKKNLFIFTEEKQKNNKVALSDLIKKIQNNFQIKVKIFSNTNIDFDLYYCTFAKYLITDCGGFDQLIEKLNEINKNNDLIYSFWKVQFFKIKIKSISLKIKSYKNKIKLLFNSITKMLSKIF